MKQILLKIAENKNVTIEHLEILPDHVQMMISFQPDIAPSNVVKSLKGTSARGWFKLHTETKKQLWDNHLWSSSFFMSTVGNVSKKSLLPILKIRCRNLFLTSENEGLFRSFITGINSHIF